MPFDQDDLIACLALTEVGPGLLEGPNLDIGYHRVFGGQILAQVAAAAAAASPQKSVKSIHVLFPREGDTSTPMRYRVTKLQDGRTFGSTEVVAEQDGKVISAALVSMHVGEDGLHRSDDAPAVGPPEEAPEVDLGMVPWETRLVGDADLSDRAAWPPRLDWWMRAAPVPDDPPLHQALLAHATDLTLIGTALRPFEGFSQADSTVSLHTAVTSHTVWFHQPFRVDAWLQISQHSPVVAGGRSYGRGDVFADGELVASFAQEAMIRRISPTRGGASPP
jgi:acyl-CoA thioesterase-2